jgi:hypothetical protein
MAFAVCCENLLATRPVIKLDDEVLHNQSIIKNNVELLGRVPRPG